MAKILKNKKTSFKVKAIPAKTIDLNLDEAHSSNRLNTTPSDVGINNSRCCMGTGMSCNNCKICRTNLDDQVRVLFGIFVIIFITLGYYVDSSYFYITGVGGGFYMLSGLTGICFIKKILQCIPCNKNKSCESK